MHPRHPRASQPPGLFQLAGRDARDAPSPQDPWSCDQSQESLDALHGPPAPEPPWKLQWPDMEPPETVPE
jgi:hypothetical protein